MSVEDRLCAGLAADANTLHPAIEGELEVVLERVAHRRRRRWVVRGAGIAAATAIVATVTTLALGPDRDARTDPADEPPRQGLAVLAGVYVVDVPASRDALRLSLAGRWTVTIAENGELGLTPPPGQVGGVSGASLRVDGDLAETNALSSAPGCQVGTGTYRWDLDQDTVSFEPVNQDCRARTLLFSDSTWSRVR